jgi:hypothetical protein
MWMIIKSCMDEPVRGVVNSPCGRMKTGVWIDRGAGCPVSWVVGLGRRERMERDYRDAFGSES